MKRCLKDRTTIIDTSFIKNQNCIKNLIQISLTMIWQLSLLTAGAMTNVLKTIFGIFLFSKITGRRALVMPVPEKNTCLVDLLPSNPYHTAMRVPQKNQHVLPAAPDPVGLIVVFVWICINTS